MDDPQRQLKERFQRALGRAFGPDFAAVDPLITLSKDARFGDYQANVAMRLGKQLKCPPRQAAQKIVEHVDLQGLCSKIEVAGPGFINLRLDDAYLNAALTRLAAEQQSSIDPDRPAQRVVVDYLSPNMAKEMHVGHIRSACIGDCIVRVLEAVGDHVIRLNHLGDWGTQFGMLLEHLIDTGWDDTSDHTISDLNDLYRQSQERFGADAAFADRARARVVKLQSGDEQALRYWQLLIDESIRHMNQMIQRLDLRLTDADIRGESFYNAQLSEVVSDLAKAGLLHTSRGAQVVFPEGHEDRNGDPFPMIVQKSDGGYLYATTDLASIRYRVDELQAQRIVYLTDARQSQHFAMLFATARTAGWAPSEVRLDHVPFGSILGEDRKPFKTRQGGTVKLADVLDEAVSRAELVIKQKHPEMPAEQRDRIARTLGIGAIKYADLCSDRIKDYVFDWDRMLALDGNTAPYLLNAYVRIRSIFRKGELSSADVLGQPVRLDEPSERALAIQLLQLPAVLESVAESLEPHRLCTYLYDLATLFHRFYEQCSVLNAPDEPTRQSRLVLCELTARHLRTALDLLGIGVVEQM